METALPSVSVVSKVTGVSSRSSILNMARSAFEAHGPSVNDAALRGRSQNPTPVPARKAPGTMSLGVSVRIVHDPVHLASTVPVDEEVVIAALDRGDGCLGIFGRARIYVRRKRLQVRQRIPAKRIRQHSAGSVANHEGSIGECDQAEFVGGLAGPRVASRMENQGCASLPRSRSWVGGEQIGSDGFAQRSKWCPCFLHGLRGLAVHAADE